MLAVLLLRLYPARWRDRYGDEFEVLLRERTLGPFDALDVLLGAVDAHLHLRGLAAASDHRKGITMSLRIGGYAAIVGGILWFIALLGSALVQDSFSIFGLLLLAATVVILVGLAGLSAFQSRTHPVLIWAAFLVAASGGLISVVGLLAMSVVGDRPWIAGMSPWYVWMIGLLTLIVGSALFALGTWRTRTLSRAGAALLGIGAIAIPFMLAGIGGVGLPEPVGQALTVATMLAFSGGWVVLGLSALRADRPPLVAAAGVS